jgi:hypothetical protein
VDAVEKDKKDEKDRREQDNELDSNIDEGYELGELDYKTMY